MDSLEPIKRKIYEIRGRRVMLDSDLAELYAVETRNLNQAVKRNIERFPDDFMFQLTKEEWSALKSQNASIQQLDIQDDSGLTSQNVILKKNGRGLFNQSLRCRNKGDVLGHRPRRTDQGQHHVSSRQPARTNDRLPSWKARLPDTLACGVS